MMYILGPIQHANLPLDKGPMLIYNKCYDRIIAIIFIITFIIIIIIIIMIIIIIIIIIFIINIIVNILLYSAVILITVHNKPNTIYFSLPSSASLHFQQHPLNV